jgi:hypothetical protein
LRALFTDEITRTTNRESGEQRGSYNKAVGKFKI